MQIPFLDLKAHHYALRNEIDVAIREVIDSGAFASGPFVEMSSNVGEYFPEK